MINQEVQRSLVRVCSILNSHNVEYLVVGGPLLAIMDTVGNLELGNTMLNSPLILTFGITPQ